MINFGAAHQLAQANVRDPVKLRNPLQFFNYQPTERETTEEKPSEPEQLPLSSAAIGSASPIPGQQTLFGPGPLNLARSRGPATAPPPPSGPMGQYNMGRRGNIMTSQAAFRPAGLVSRSGQLTAPFTPSMTPPPSSGGASAPAARRQAPAPSFEPPPYTPGSMFVVPRHEFEGTDEEWHQENAARRNAEAVARQVTGKLMDALNGPPGPAHALGDDGPGRVSLSPAANTRAGSLPPDPVPSRATGLVSRMRQSIFGRTPAPPAPAPPTPLEANAQRLRRSEEEWANTPLGQGPRTSPPPLSPGFSHTPHGSAPEPPSTRSPSPTPGRAGRVRRGDDGNSFVPVTRRPRQTTLFGPATPVTSEPTPTPPRRSSTPTRRGPRPVEGQEELFAPSAPPVGRQFEGQYQQGWNTPARSVEMPRRAAPQQAPAAPYQGTGHEDYDVIDRNAPDIRTFPGFGRPPRAV